MPHPPSPVSPPPHPPSLSRTLHQLLQYPTDFPRRSNSLQKRTHHVFLLHPTPHQVHHSQMHPHPSPSNKTIQPLPSQKTLQQLSASPNLPTAPSLGLPNTNPISGCQNKPSHPITYRQSPVMAPPKVQMKQSLPLRLHPNLLPHRRRIRLIGR